jgi:hypothetical protein
MLDRTSIILFRGGIVLSEMDCGTRLCAKIPDRIEDSWYGFRPEVVSRHDLGSHQSLPLSCVYSRPDPLLTWHPKTSEDRCTESVYVSYTVCGWHYVPIVLSQHHFPIQLFLRLQTTHSAHYISRENQNTWALHRKGVAYLLKICSFGIAQVPGREVLSGTTRIPRHPTKVLHRWSGNIDSYSATLHFTIVVHIADLLGVLCAFKSNDCQPAGESRIFWLVRCKP